MAAGPIGLANVTFGDFSVEKQAVSKYFGVIIVMFYVFTDNVTMNQYLHQDPTPHHPTTRVFLVLRGMPSVMRY